MLSFVVEFRIGEAQTVLVLLLERGNLEAPLRQSLMKQVSQPNQGWRIQIEDCMKKQQPFLFFGGGKASCVCFFIHGIFLVRCYKVKKFE